MTARGIYWGVGGGHRKGVKTGPGDRWGGAGGWGGKKRGFWQISERRGWGVQSGKTGRRRSGRGWEDRGTAQRTLCSWGPEPCPEDAAMMHVGTGQGK